MIRNFVMIMCYIPFHSCSLNHSIFNWPNFTNKKRKRKTHYWKTISFSIQNSSIIIRISFSCLSKHVTLQSAWKLLKFICPLHFSSYPNGSAELCLSGCLTSWSCFLIPALCYWYLFSVFDPNQVQKLRMAVKSKRRNSNLIGDF